MQRFIYALILIGCLHGRVNGSDIIGALKERYANKEYKEVVTSIDSLLATGHTDSLSRLYQIKADALYFLNEVDESLTFYLKTLEVLPEYPMDTVYLIEAWSHTGFVYDYLGQYVEAIPYYQKALSISITAKDSVEASNQLFHLGSLNANLGRYDKAAEYYNRCYQIDFQLRDSTAIGYDLSSLADMKMKVEDFEGAIEYYRLSLEHKAVRADNHNVLILRKGKLAKAYLDNDQLDSARKYNTLSIKGALEIQDSLSLMKQCIVKSSILIRELNFEDAIALSNECLEYFSQGEENEYQVSSSFVLIESYMKTKKYTSAKQLLLKNIQVCLRNNLLPQLVLAYDKMSILLEAQGEFEASLTYRKKFLSVQDSLFEKNKLLSITLLEQEYQLANKEQQIEILKAREELALYQSEKKQKRIIWLLLILALTIIGAAYIYYSNRQRSMLEQQLLQSQLNELRGQLKLFVEGEVDTQKAIKKLVDMTDVQFSKREMQILEYAFTDLSNSEIAEKTFVSVNTVKFHLRNIYTKMGVSNRQQIKEYIVQS